VAAAVAAVLVAGMMAQGVLLVEDAFATVVVEVVGVGYDGMMGKSR